MGPAQGPGQHRGGAWPGEEPGERQCLARWGHGRGRGLGYCLVGGSSTKDALLGGLSAPPVVWVSPASSKDFPALGIRAVMPTHFLKLC